jgi:hypothetical protein
LPVSLRNRTRSLLAARSGHGRPDVESMVADRTVVGADPRSAGLRLEQLRLASFDRTLERIGLPDHELATALNDHYLQKRFTDVPLFDDVLPVLSQLSARMPLGLLSPTATATPSAPDWPACSPPSSSPISTASANLTGDCSTSQPISSIFRQHTWR